MNTLKKSIIYVIYQHISNIRLNNVEQNLPALGLLPNNSLPRPSEIAEEGTIMDESIPKAPGQEASRLQGVEHRRGLVITRSRIARDSITKSMIFVKTGEVSLLGFCPCFGFCACHACSWPRLGRSTRSLRPVRKDSTRWGKTDAENPSVGEPSGSKRSTSKHLGVQQLRLFKVDWSVNWDPLGLLNQRFFFLCFKTVVWFLQWCIFLSSDMLVVLKGHM